MSVSNIGIAHWRALPFPLRIAVGVLAVVVVIWLAQWLGSASTLLALCIWTLVLTGILHASGRMPWIDRRPTISRFLNAYAPPISGSVTPKPRSAASAPSLRPTIPDTARFAGISDVNDEIASVVASRSILKSTMAPATIVFLVGPRGTGKSSLALTMADDLYKAKVIKSDRIVAISETELPGLGSSYGPTPEILRDLTALVQSALDGVLLIDDIDQMVSLASGQVAQETGSRVLDVARRFPGRLFVLCTGSAEALAALDPARRWLGQLNVRRIEFPTLDDDALRQIFLQSLSSQGFRTEPDAERAVALRLQEIRQEGGETFDNAYAVHRFVDAVLHNHGLRLRRQPAATMAEQRVIVAADVRNAFASV